MNHRDQSEKEGITFEGMPDTVTQTEESPKSFDMNTPFQPSEAAREEMRQIIAWRDDPASPDCYELREWRNWKDASAKSEAMREGGDDEAMAQMDWVVPGDQLQALLTQCSDDTTKFRVSKDSFPFLMSPLGCTPDVLDELLNEIGATHRDLVYTDLYIAVIHQMRGKVLDQIHSMIRQMIASLIVQMLAENASKNHLPYEWPGPLPKKPFACLNSTSPFTWALRFHKWKTTKLTEAQRLMDVPRTYVRRMIDSSFNGTPIMPLTNDETLEMVAGEDSKEFKNVLARMVAVRKEAKSDEP